MPAQITHRGDHYALGAATNSYAIWSATGGKPIRTWPKTDEGWELAWREWTRLETEEGDVYSPPTTSVLTPAVETTSAVESQSQAATAARPSSSYGTAAMVLGVIGVIFGLIPLFFWVALVCGALALIFGILGRSYRNRGMAIAGVVLGLGSLALGTYGATVINDVADRLSAPTATQPAEPPTSQESSEPASRVARVGDSIELGGNSPGLQLLVTLTTVTDPLTPSNEFIGPAEGRRWIGVELLIRNTGDDAYGDAPSNGASLIDAQDRQYNATFSGETGEMGSIDLAPGDQRRGLLVFEVPIGVELRAFQWTPESGFGPTTGQWLLG